MKASIIIPACNEEKCIESALKSINSQDYPDFETIVVCNGCTDSTEALAKKLATKVLIQEEGHVSKARNLGAKNAEGQILIFQDADVILKNPNTIKEISKKLQKARVGTCKITPNPKNIKSTIYSTAKNNLWFFNWSNGIIYLTKDTFNKINGFNENLTKKEDSNLISKAKKHGAFKITKSKVELSMRRLEKRGYIKTTLFWVREFFFPNKKPYEIIR